MTTAGSQSVRPGDQTFFGHPKGLFFLAATEAAERFSFYGMTALVVLYMVNQLLLPGHVEYVAGFSKFRGAWNGSLVRFLHRRLLRRYLVSILDLFTSHRSSVA